MQLSSTAIAGVFVSPEQPETVAKSGFGVGIRGALAAGQPGTWASDHRAEAEKFAGSHYIAIRALCLQAAQATVTVYDDRKVGQARAKSFRAAWRQSLGGRWKTAKQNEPEANALPEDHRLVKLYHRPNPWQSGALFRYEQVLQLCLTGKLLVWKVPNRLGLTVERYVVPTAVASPVPPTRELPNGGYRIDPMASMRWATLTDPDGFVETRGFYRACGKIIPMEQILQLYWPHPLFKDDGQSPVAASALWTDTGEMIDRSRWAHLKNGPDPSIAITAGEGTEPSEADLDRAAAKFNAKYASPQNHGKAAFFGHGTDVKPLSTTPKDMVYTEGFDDMLDATLAIHGVPRLAAGLESPSGRDGLYAPLLQFSLLTVQPMLSILAGEETAQQAPEFGQGLTVEIEAQSIDDPEMLEQALQTDNAVGARTIDEVRSVRGLPPVPWGSERAMVGGAQTAATTGPDAGEPEPGGEFGQLGRRQWQNNRKAIRDVVTEFADGSITETMAMAQLEMLGISPERAQRLIADARDGKVDEEENTGLLNGNGKTLHKTNGHANGHADEDWLAKAVAVAWRR